jgi:hypothetical protein
LPLPATKLEGVLKKKNWKGCCYLLVCPEGSGVFGSTVEPEVQPYSMHYCSIISLPFTSKLVQIVTINLFMSRCG